MCFLVFIKINTSACEDKAFLMSKGFKLIVFSGLLLTSLQGLVDSINSIPMVEEMCLKFLDQYEIDRYTNGNCSEIIATAGGTTKSLLTLLMQAFSWLVPLVFAGVGVNILTNGVALPAKKNDLTEEKLIKKFHPKLQPFISYIVKNLG